MTDVMATPQWIGERASVSGSRSFRRLIEAQRFDDAADLAWRQLGAGATLLDLSTAGATVDESMAMCRLVDAVRQRTEATLLIDSVDPAVFAAALPRCRGHVWINSVNAAMSSSTIGRVVELALRHGARVVVGCIDEFGPARTVARKLAIAQFSVDQLTTTFSLRPSDLVIDPVVFPCQATAAKPGDLPLETKDTLAAIQAIRTRLRVDTIVAISNLSWTDVATSGSRQNADDERNRADIETSFLDLATAAGLSYAIIHTTRLADRIRSAAAHVATTAPRRTT